MSKVKINPKYPDNPGMVDEKFRFHTLEWDMLDDLSRFPTKHMMEQSVSSSNSPFYLRLVKKYHNGVPFIGGDWEDLASAYRSERDRRFDADRNYYRSLLTRMPFQFREFRYIGPGYLHGFSNLTVTEYGQWDSSEYEKTHFIFPSMEDGSNNYPLLYPGGVGQPYAYINSTHEFKEVACKMLPSLKFRDIYFQLFFYELEGLPLIGDGILADKARYAPTNTGITLLDDLYGGWDKLQAYLHNENAIIDLKITKACLISIGLGLDEVPLNQYGNDSGQPTINQINNQLTDRLAYSNSIVFDYASHYDDAKMSIMFEYLSGGQHWLRENPNNFLPRKSLFDIFGESELHFLPGVKYISQLANIQGQVGQCISVYESSNQGDHNYAWDHINEEWSTAFYNAFISPIENVIYYSIGNYGTISYSLFEVTLAMKPFTWANHHMPCLWIFDGVKTNIEKVVVDFSALNS